VAGPRLDHHVAGRGGAELAQQPADPAAVAAVARRRERGAQAQAEAVAEAVAAQLDRIEAQLAVLVRALGQETAAVGVVAEGEGGEL
jgi:hypothetical protein